MNKTELISFKIDSETKNKFLKLCCEKHTTPSHELRLFVHQKIKQMAGVKISLEQFKDRKV
jgi:antitoxin component of RelBE/YafQ-DinJ toxin-antitoxin module